MPRIREKNRLTRIHGRTLAISNGILFGLWSAFCGEATSGQESSIDLPSIARLVSQLDATSLKTRNLAEIQLIAKGRAVPDWLERHAAGLVLTAESRHRLHRIRGQIFDDSLRQAIRESKVVIDDPIDAGQLSNLIERQTGNRLNFAPETKIQLVEAGTYSFWKLVETVSLQNDLVTEHSPTQGLTLVAATASLRQPRAVGNAGPIRMEWLPENESAEKIPSQIRLRLLWEPRLQVIGIRIPMSGVTISDDDGNAWADFNRQAILSIPAATARHQVQFRLPLRRRSQRIPGPLVIGAQLSVVAPLADVTFRDITGQHQPDHPKPVGMATVSIHEIERDSQGLRIQVLTRYDRQQMAQALQSWQAWGELCSAMLVDGEARSILPVDTQQIRQGKYEYLVEFRFVLPRDSGSGWHLNFKIPSGLTRIDETILLQPHTKPETRGEHP